MLFGGRQLEEKNNKIRELEEKVESLQSQIDGLQSKVRAVLDEKAEVDRKVTAIEGENGALKHERDALSEQLKRLKENEQRNTAELKGAQATIEEERAKAIKIQNDAQKEKEALQRQLQRYQNMSPDAFLKLGTDLFTLEVLTQILERAQSEAFRVLQNNRKKAVLQPIVNLFETVLRPIHVDHNLLQLLDVVEPSAGAAEILPMLEHVTVREIITAPSVNLNKCMATRAVKKTAVPKLYLFDAKDPTEYCKKMTLAQLVSVLDAISKK